MAKLVSKVYGDALFEVAVESGRLDEIWEQTRAMQTALEENPELFALMRHPKIVKEEKVRSSNRFLPVRCVQNWWDFCA